MGTQSMFWAEISKIIYPCKSQCYYIKLGFKGVKIILACFRDVKTNSCDHFFFRFGLNNNQNKIEDYTGLYFGYFRWLINLWATSKIPDQVQWSLPLSREMFKTMRCFRTHAQRKRISSGAKGVRFVRIYLPQSANIGFLFYCCLYKVHFSFLRAAFEFRIPRWIMEVFVLLRHLYYI